MTVAVSTKTVGGWRGDRDGRNGSWKCILGICRDYEGFRFGNPCVVGKEMSCHGRGREYGYGESVCRVMDSLVWKNR